MGDFGAALRDAFVFFAIIVGSPVLLAVFYGGLAWVIRKLSKIKEEVSYYD